MHPSVAILGAGSMGEIFAKGLLRAGWDPADLVLAARRPERATEAEHSTGVAALIDPVAAAVDRDVVVIAVKPSDVSHLLGQIHEVVTDAQLIISIAAGVPLAVFEEVFPKCAVVRAMPNTPAAVDEGMTAYCCGRHADDSHIEVARKVLAAVGQTLQLDEDLLDAVTAVSGSGPAYIYLLAEAMTEAAIREGLPHHAAEKLVNQTLKGAGALLAASHDSPTTLRGQVTSPGGTTAAAVHVLEEGGFRAMIEDAVAAAADRSREMGEQASEA